MNLIELALTTYTESNAEQADTADDTAKRAREEFLDNARANATANLCLDAAALDWLYVTEGLPDNVEEARALLAPGRTEYLRYRVDNAQMSAAFELVQPCGLCRNDRIEPVTSLYQLGQLLNEEGEPHDQAADDTGGREPGPLAPIEQAGTHAERVARLARRLIAAHPDAGLAIQHVSIFGHEHGDGRAEIHFNTDGLDALRRVAAPFGTEVAVRASGTRPGLVLEHGSATFAVDGIDVNITGYSQMPEDRAAVWLAQQDQAADGGDAG